VRFLLPRTQLRRVPLLRRALPCGRTRGTRIARPSSVPSSGFLPLSTVSAGSRLARGLWNPAVHRGPQRFAAFFHAARVPGAPLQSFPFPGSRTRSRGPLLPCGFVLRLPPAQCLQSLHGRFPRFAPALCHTHPPEGRRGTHEPGRRFLAVASPVASTRTGRAARTVRSPPTLGSPVNGRHARFEALLPPGVRSATTSPPGQAEAARRCSPGVSSPFRALSTTVRDSVTRVDARGGQSPMPRTPPGAQPSRLHFRDPDSDAWAHEPRIRRYAGSIELRASPSSGDPAHQAPLERFCAPVASPVPRPAGR